ncbi:molybdopterin molybdotransferase MoeA [uncultured Veillonella sp.]|uniref:molybdopterin molybdotransferase MoeA n=1 Tax=uncultured Veillonella sp. TaxID=159268 RepID=UPI0025F0744B|nr:molybdopterin molybdotransferase MoeA [uncultured Veillonella sp.]
MATIESNGVWYIVNNIVLSGVVLWRYATLICKDGDYMKAITVDECQQIWREKLSHRQLQAVEYIPISEALGRVLGEDIVAKTDMPPFRKSPYDGYVIAYSEGQQRFKVVGLIGAGETYDAPVKSDEAVRIMTGAPIPEGCDTMIMQERCDVEGGYIVVRGEIKQGDNIVPQGEECATGDVIIKAGAPLDAGAIAVAAGLGYATIAVYKPLTVLVLTSGREVVALDKPLGAGQIYNSNQFMLTNLLASYGFSIVKTYHVSDDPALLDSEIETVRSLSEDVDVIMSTGGVSVGLFDSMPAIYKALGAEELYTRMLMRPGAASFGGLIQKDTHYTLCFGLSGNPTAAYNGFHLLALPILKLCQGYSVCDTLIVPIRLGSTIHKKNPFDRYVQGVITYDEKGAQFTPNRVFTSSALLGLAQANGLAKLDQGKHSYEAGETVPVMILKNK